jgi:hypothetical protein
VLSHSELTSAEATSTDVGIKRRTAKATSTGDMHQRRRYAPTVNANTMQNARQGGGPRSLDVLSDVGKSYKWVRGSGGGHEGSPSTPAVVDGDHDTNRHSALTQQCAAPWRQVTVREGDKRRRSASYLPLKRQAPTSAPSPDRKGDKRRRHAPVTANTMRNARQGGGPRSLDVLSDVGKSCMWCRKGGKRRWARGQPKHPGCC